MSQEGFSGGKTLFTATVGSNLPLNRKFYRLCLDFDNDGTAAFSKVTPGQFIEIDLSGIALPSAEKIPPDIADTARRQVLLRRPFSFSDIRNIAGKAVRAEILYCVLGPSTLRMTTLSPGDTISLIGPCGNGFSVPKGKKHAILVAGGMGAPPIRHLAGFLKKHSSDMLIHAFAGAQTIDDLPFHVKISNKLGLYLEEFQQIDIPAFIATDDGSAGRKGFVTDCLCEWLDNNMVKPAETVIYACGPEAMLAAVSNLSARYGIDCQISMERMMACGIGLCQSCAVEVKADTEDSVYRLCCKDGPVFNATEVIFNCQE